MRHFLRFFPYTAKLWAADQKSSKIRIRYRKLRTQKKGNTYWYDLKKTILPYRKNLTKA